MFAMSSRASFWSLRPDGPVTVPVGTAIGALLYSADELQTALEEEASELQEELAALLLHWLLLELLQLLEELELQVEDVLGVQVVVGVEVVVGVQVDDDDDVVGATQVLVVVVGGGGVQVEVGVVDVAGGGVQVVVGVVLVVVGATQVEEEVVGAAPPEPEPSLNHQVPERTPSPRSAKCWKRPSEKSRPP